MPPLSPIAEQVAVYAWPDGWSIVRPLSEERMSECVKELWNGVFTKPDAHSPWGPGQRRRHWMWPTDTQGTENVYNKLRTFQRTVQAGVFPVDPVLFVLTDPKGTVKAGMRFDTYPESTRDSQQAWIPKLDAVLSVDGSRVVDPVLQGRLLEFVFGFVYVQLFGNSAETVMCLRDDAEWGLGLPMSWTGNLEFDAVTSGPEREAFDAAIPVLSDPYDERREQVMLEVVPPYVAKVGQSLNPHRPRMAPWVGHSSIYTLRYLKRLKVWAPSPDTLTLVIEFDASDARHWRWKIGWESDDLGNIHWVSRGQDLADMLVKAGIVSDLFHYWALIEERIVEGAPTFDPEALESYEMMKVLPPLYQQPEAFRAWWEAM